MDVEKYDSNTTTAKRIEATNAEELADKTTMTALEIDHQRTTPKQHTSLSNGYRDDDDDVYEDDDDDENWEAGRPTVAVAAAASSSGSRRNSRSGFTGWLLLGISLVAFLAMAYQRSNSHSVVYNNDNNNDGTSDGTASTTSITVSSQQPQRIDPTNTKTTTTTTTSSRIPKTSSKNKNKQKQDDLNQLVLVSRMKERLRPRRLLLDATQNANSKNNNGLLLPLQAHQFLHMHHMKTGGTSLDGLVQCGLQRLRSWKATAQTNTNSTLTGTTSSSSSITATTRSLAVNYTNIHECSEAHYDMCLKGTDARCLESVQTAALLSFCAPLSDLSTPFQWLPSTSATYPTTTKEDATAQAPPKTTTTTAPSLYAAVTVLRHPVARVWSMFRFQTKHCYSCRNLTDVYASMDQEIATGGHGSLSKMCRYQLLNHQTRNLLLSLSDSSDSTSQHDNNVPDSEWQVQVAIRNLQQVFTMVGLTEDMNNTARMVELVFPWLAKTVDWSTAIDWPDDDLLELSIASNDGGGGSRTATCSLPHANSSPQNNGCGKNGGHWDLPPVPDEATRNAILEHNAMDVKVYEAALQQFQLQKQALGLT